MHHHHYPDSVINSSEAESVEDDYVSDVDYYGEDEYMEGDYVDTSDYYEEDEYSDYNSEFSGEIESDYIFTTSCDEDSCCSGSEESSY